MMRVLVTGGMGFIGSAVCRALVGRDIPTAARRPQNSRLDCGKTERTFGLRLAPWQGALEGCLDDLAGACVEAQR